MGPCRRSTYRYVVKTPKVRGRKIYVLTCRGAFSRSICATLASSLRSHCGLSTHIVRKLFLLSLVNISAWNLARYRELLKLCTYASFTTPMRYYRVTLCSSLLCFLSCCNLSYQSCLSCVCYSSAIRLRSRCLCYSVACCRASTLALASLVIDRFPWCL